MDAFMAFIGKFAGDLGAVAAAGNVVVGDRLGLYRGLADRGPSTAAELAAWTGTDARYVAEWLAGQAAGGYIEYADGPVDVAGAFTLALGALAAVPAVTEAFRTGAGIGWHEHSDDVFTGCERFSAPGTRPISSRTGCPHCPASCPALPPAAPWRTSGADSGRRACCSRPRSPPPASPAPTTMPSRSRSPRSGPPTRAARTGWRSRPRPPNRSPAPGTTW